MSRRRHDGPVPLDVAMRDLRRIAPELREPTDDVGDPERAIELAARREEGRGRHGFRSLIDELG